MASPESRPGAEEEEQLLDEQPSAAAPAAADADAEAEIEEATERGVDGSQLTVDGDGPADAEVADDAAVADDGGDAEEEEPADPLTMAERERDEYLVLAKRTQADFENYRKRAARDAAAASERAKATMIRELLPVIDNLERALAAAEDGEGALAKGVELVHVELTGLLERNGVKGFEPAGEPFDPNLHEALTTRSEDGTESGVVLEVAQKGYRLGDSVIRPARVVVSA